MIITEPKDTLRFLRELGSYNHVECFERLQARAEAAEAKYARLVERLRELLEEEKIAVIGNYKSQVMPTLFTKKIEAAINESEAEG